MASAASKRRLPLSDKDLDLKAANKILSSAQTREKCLKILQYASRLVGYILLRSSWKDWGKHFETLSKSLSTARRFFKFFRFIKHFEDLAEAGEEKDPTFQKMLYLDVAANVVADVSEDWTSLEKVGILKKGSLHPRTEYYANWCQLVLAVVEVVVTKIKADRASEKASKPDAPVEVQRKKTMAQLEFSKFVADLIKAFWDCELSFASELAFILSGLWAALISTHKYALRVLK
ncbi:unnamed protein product [Effrenium voratum]|nr:unnamed protein product [Effrenium voratum]